MIKTLRLQNFQGWQDQTFEFDDQFNCIVGSGNVGKSSIIRALNFLFYNIWVKDYVSWGISHCTITISLDNGYTLIRKKGDKINQFISIDSQGKKQLYENFGTKIPEEIVQILGVFPVTLSSGEQIKLNVSSQLDPLFTQAFSAGDKAKLFGQLSGLNILDVVSQNLVTDKKQTQLAQKAIEDDLVHISSKLVELDQILYHRDSVSQIKEQLELLGHQTTELSQLQRVQHQLQNWTDKWTKIQTKLKQLPQIDINLDKLVRQIEKLEQLKSVQDQGTRLGAYRETLVNRLDQLQHQYRQDKATYLAILKEQNICPTCMTPVTPDCLDHIAKEL